MSEDARNLVRATLHEGADRARRPAVEAPVEARRAVCGECEKNVRARCVVCRCRISVITRFRLRGCPIGKWGPV